MVKAEAGVVTHDQWVLAAAANAHGEMQQLQIRWRSWEIRGHLPLARCVKTSIRIIISERHPNIWPTTDILLQRHRSSF